MKSATTRSKRPATRAEWEALIAAAPGKDRACTAAEEKKMANAIVVNGGGYAAVRTARMRGERGPQSSPTKQLVSIRYSPEVLEYFKSTGSGWQTRMNEALLEWVGKRPKESRQNKLTTFSAALEAKCSSIRHGILPA
jgi:uncharacterized protein (DUF4415 family)